MSETGSNVVWLIERAGHDGSLEYYGPELSKVAGVDVWLWTDSHLEAIRFCRRTDAERAMVHLRIMNLAAFERANVAEHMWLEPRYIAPFDPLENFAQWCLGASPDADGMVEHIIKNARAALDHARDIQNPARKAQSREGLQQWLQQHGDLYAD
jgi:hypothetical protein